MKDAQTILNKYTHTLTHTPTHTHKVCNLTATGCLRFVCPLKSQGSLAKEPYINRALLQKSRISIGLFCKRAVYLRALLQKSRISIGLVCWGFFATDFGGIRDFEGKKTAKKNRLIATL